MRTSSTSCPARSTRTVRRPPHSPRSTARPQAKGARTARFLEWWTLALADAAGDVEYRFQPQRGRNAEAPEVTSAWGERLGAGNFPLGFGRLLAHNPELATVTCGHPAVLGAVEQLLGKPATVSQFIHTLRTPGSGGTGTHYDYKPWRPVGSFLDWCFAVIPLVDYTEDIGPLLASPGSHKRTEVLPSDGRVHPVAAARLGAPPHHLVDPKLRRGDLFVFHMFCWHEAHGRNVSQLDRTGLYIKFHAANAPPAAGPMIFPTAAHDALAARGVSPEHNPIRFHRPDGRFWGRSSPDTLHVTLDTVALLLEDQETERFLLVRGEGGRWGECSNCRLGL